MTKPGTQRTQRDLERLTKSRKYYTPAERVRYEKYVEQRDQKRALDDIRQKLRAGNVLSRSFRILSRGMLRDEAGETPGDIIAQDSADHSAASHFDLDDDQ